MTLEPQETERFELEHAGTPLEIGPDGVRHPRSARLGGAPLFTRWDEVTHLSSSRLGFRLATRRGVFLFRAADLRNPADLPRCTEALRRGLGDGLAAQHLARLDAVAATPGRARVAAVLASLCALGFVLQGIWPGFHHEGFFSATLVRVGEPWRIVTANLLHASLSHLLLNLAGIAVLGWLAERSLGTARATWVVGAAGLGAMLASYGSGYERALGASGVVYGFVGAILCLEYRWPEALPAQWRIPRRAFLFALVAETLILIGAPEIAHAAHWGGFAGGALAVLAVGPRPDALAESAGPSGAVRVVAATLVLGFCLSLGAFVRNVAAPDAAALARRGERLLELESVAVDLLNNEAWQIAIAEEVDHADLDVARRMAERAVAESDGEAPAYLDTLAEIHFRRGEIDRALELIDAAIDLTPGERYYREQRRRFLGERAADDRPEDPGWTPPPPDPELPPGPPPVRV